MAKEKNDSKKNVRRTKRNATQKMTTRCRKDKQETTAGRFNWRKKETTLSDSSTEKEPQWSNEDAQEWKNRRRPRNGKEKATQTGTDTKADGMKRKGIDRIGEVETVGTTS